MLNVRGVVLPPNALAGLPQHKVIAHPQGVKVKAAGDWHDVGEMWVNDAGAWRRFYKRNENDTAVGNVLSGIVANDREMNDPSMLMWQWFWQNPAFTVDAVFEVAESAIRMTMTNRAPDDTAACRLGSEHPLWVNPGWRVRLDATIKGTARFTQGVVTAPTYEGCDFFGTGAQWQEGGFQTVPSSAFELRQAEFVVPAGHNYLRPYVSAYIDVNQAVGTRTLTTASFQQVRLS
jgi:hypothetical protein